VPVRISIDAKQLEKNPLRVGLSTAVSVDTRDRSGQMLAALPSDEIVAQTHVYERDFAAAESEADAIIAANLPHAHSP
jgi:membrane fusion protein (multidrug efflux system)